MLADPQAPPTLACVGARENLARGAGQHGFGAIDADRRVVNVGVVDPRDPRPGFTAVVAATHAVDFDAGPHHAVVRRVDRQRRHPWNANIWALFGHLGPQLVPMPSAVARAEKGCRPGARENDLGVDRIERDLPDMQRIHWRIEPLEALPAILAAVDPVIRAGEYGARLFGVNRKPEDPALGPQPASHLPPALATVGAHPSARSNGADTNREIIGHGCFLPNFAYLVFVSHPVWEMSITTPSGPAHFISKLRWPPAAISMSSSGFSSSRSPRARSSFAAVASRSSTSKPK